MIIPNQDKELINIFKCVICNKIYQKLELNFNTCLVHHSPGSCCHYNDKEISSEIVDKIKDLLK